MLKKFTDENKLIRATTLQGIHRDVWTINNGCSCTVHYAENMPREGLISYSVYACKNYARGLMDDNIKAYTIYELCYTTPVHAPATEQAL